MKRWWHALAWPLVLAALAHLAFPPIGQRDPDRITVLPDGTQVRQWDAAPAWAFALVAAVSLLAGWRAVRHGGLGRIAATVAGALVACVTHLLMPCAMASIKLAQGTLVPEGLRSFGEDVELQVVRDACEVSLFGTLAVVPLYALVGLLGGWLAARSRPAAA